MVRFSRVSSSLLLFGSLAMAGLPGVASAQSMTPSMLVQTTPTFTVVLEIGPAAPMVAPGTTPTNSDAEVMVGQVGMPMMTTSGSSTGMGETSSMGMGAGQSSSMGTGAGSMSGGMGSTSGSMSDMSDQGMAVNHHLEVHITDNSSGAVVNDVTPVIRIRDKSSGVSRDLNDVMAMYGAMMGPADFHYGQNIWLPDGQYDVTVMLGNQSALFRDVQVSGGGMMMMGG